MYKILNSYFTELFMYTNYVIRFVIKTLQEASILSLSPSLPSFSTENQSPNLKHETIEYKQIWKGLVSDVMQSLSSS